MAAEQPVAADGPLRGPPLNRSVSPTMGSLHLDTVINVPLERCFDLARSIEVHCETAAFTDERAVEPGRTSGLLEHGDTVVFEARHLGFRQRLVAEVVEFEPPHRFVDEMRRGAFQSLRHEHRFEAVDGGTLMRDRLDWKVPGGPLGLIVDRLIVTPHMRWFLTSKQGNLKRYAETHSGSARERRGQLMNSIWSQVRDLFEHDDGSLPEIELTNLGPAAIPRVLATLWRRGHDATAGGASYCDRRDGQDKPIVSAEDAANAAALVCSREAESIHAVLGGLEYAGSRIPDLGVFVHPDGVILDYRKGSAWGPQEVAVLFELLLTIAETEPDLAMHHQYSDEAFDVALAKYREARRII